MNKQIKGSQCTITWHIDDLKLSHISPDVLEELLEQLKAGFRTMAPLLTNRGPVHDYLGMTLDFSMKGKVQVTMINYIHDMLAELPADMDSVASTPAADHLFQVNPWTWKPPSFSTTMSPSYCFYASMHGQTFKLLLHF